MEHWRLRSDESFCRSRNACGDNNPSSSFYGRQYIAWNNFDNHKDIDLVYSDDGTTWTGPVTIYSAAARFIRNSNMWVGADGTVFVAGNDIASYPTVTPFVFYSTDGGSTWTEVQVTGSQSAPGQSAPLCIVNGFAQHG